MGGAMQRGEAAGMAAAAAAMAYRSSPARNANGKHQWRIGAISVKMNSQRGMAIQPGG